MLLRKLSSTARGSPVSIKPGNWHFNFISYSVKGNILLNFINTALPKCGTSTKAASINYGALFETVAKFIFGIRFLTQTELITYGWGSHNVKSGLRSKVQKSILRWSLLRCCILLQPLHTSLQPGGTCSIHFSIQYCLIMPVSETCETIQLQ